MSKNILMNEVRMDTQTAYFVNGNINIHPACYEHPEPLTAERFKSYPAHQHRLARPTLQGALPHRTLRCAAVDQRQDSGVLEVLAHTEHPRDLPHPQARKPHDYGLSAYVEVIIL